MYGGDVGGVNQGKSGITVYKGGVKPPAYNADARCLPLMYGGIGGVDPPYVRRRHLGVDPPQHTAWGELTPPTVHYGGIGGVDPPQSVSSSKCQFCYVA